MTETCTVCNGTGNCKGSCENGWKADGFSKRGCLICEGDGGIGEVRQGKGHCVTCDGTGKVEKQGFPFS